MPRIEKYEERLEIKKFASKANLCESEKSNPAANFA